MTDQPVDQALTTQRPFTLDELARAQHVIPLRGAEDLCAEELWETDDELDAFLADLADARHARPA